jgi:formylglycine-generating enzyme required for sulfatase activity
MDKNLVSYSQWQSIYSWATNHGYAFDNVGTGKAANHPVQTVDWCDVLKWSNARSQQAGLTPVYYTDAGLTRVYTIGDTDAVYPNWSANGYRLPTEAEWEKAARGGLSGQRFPWGNTISWSQANYYGDPLSLDPVFGYAYDFAPAVGFDPAFNDGVLPYTSPVGSFAANGYGLYDMAGNVFEWCWDWYAAPPYPPGSPYLGGTDPRGPVGPVGPWYWRVMRGGDWGTYAYAAWCAYRGGSYLPNYALDASGFRCVRGR